MPLLVAMLDLNAEEAKPEQIRGNTTAILDPAHDRCCPGSLDREASLHIEMAPSHHAVLHQHLGGSHPLRFLESM